MAGKYFTVNNPAYSLCYVEDRPYIVGTGETAGLNPLDPTSARPLIEGEWLQPADSSNRPRWQRGGNNAVTESGTPDGEGTVPAFPYFMEKGRYDAQASKLVHCIVGPVGFFFRTKLIDTDSLSDDGNPLAVGEKLSVWDWDGPSGGYSLVRRVLARATSSGFVVGRVHRIHGDNDVTVQYFVG